MMASQQEMLTFMVDKRVARPTAHVPPVIEARHVWKQLKRSGFTTRDLDDTPYQHLRIEVCGAMMEKNQFMQTYLRLFHAAVAAVPREDRLSKMNDETLNNMFRYIDNWCVSLPLAKTCRRVWLLWTRERRQLAVGMMRGLIDWLSTKELDETNSSFYARSFARSASVEISSFMITLVEIEELIR